MENNLKTKISQILFEFFVKNNRYFAIQEGSKYIAKRDYVNQFTIERILNHKESFLCYQEDFNYIKWICFDFDVSKKLIEDGSFERDKQIFYEKLIDKIEILCKFLDSKEIDYLLEFSGRRGVHLWILFNENITRQEGYIILETILNEAQMNLDTNSFPLDKFPKSANSKSNTDKGMGVKMPLSYHQKSKKYSYLLKKLKNFNIEDSLIENLNKEFLQMQLQILKSYKKINKNEIFKKLDINEEDIKKVKDEFVKTRKTFTKNKDLVSCVKSLSQCSHIDSILNNNKPNDGDRKIIVGLFGQLRNKSDNKYIGKNLLMDFFMSRDSANESITAQKLAYCNMYYPVTCDFLRTKFNQECSCETIKQTPLEYLNCFEYLPEEIFELTEELFHNIRNAQIKYSRQNDEITLFHTQNILNKLEYEIIKENVNEFFKTGSYKVGKFYQFEREEKSKKRYLYSLNAKDKVITTFAIKVLDSILYTKFSLRSYGYKFNSSFMQKNIFEPWLYQWKQYIGELKTLIYSDDFKNYYVLKLDLKSYYDRIKIEKLKEELNQEINHNLESKIINKKEKNIFSNIVSNLLGYSKKLNGNKECGLPQGPAFARYLAEFHLTSLDGIIEKFISDRGHYYRYVDDIFVILPTKKEIDEVEKLVKEHLGAKYLEINGGKFHKSEINTFKKEFEEYVDDNKYFIDKVSKNKEIYTQKTIYSYANKLLKLIEDEDKNINDRHLSFFFTHLDNIDIIKDKRKELEKYIINQAIGRGSLFYNFFKYFFENNSFNEIDFDIFKNLKGLKREVFLNYLIYLLSKNSFNENKSLKDLLNLFLQDKLTYIDKLLIFQIYLVDGYYFNYKTLELIESSIDDAIDIYNDSFLSPFTKEVSIEILDKFFDILGKLDSLDEQFEYLYKLILFSEINSIQTLHKFSEKFIDKINTKIDNDKRSKLKYLTKKSNIYKYVQLLYIATLFFQNTNNDKNKKDFESLIYPVWHNFLFNLKSKNNMDFSKSLYWKKQIENISLEDSNINFIMPLIKKDKNKKLEDGNNDEFKVIDNFFNTLIELVYLSNKDEIGNISELKKIKEFLIKDKKVKYLEWLDSDKSKYYPTPEICIKNTIFNDMIILRDRDTNEILVRLRSDLTFSKDIDYLIKEEIPECIFEGKYKAIIYNFDVHKFYQPYDKSYNDLFDFINEVLTIHSKNEDFLSKYNTNRGFVNYFYKEVFIDKDSGYPLIPYDIFGKYFINDDNYTYNLRDRDNYYKNIIKTINAREEVFFENEQLSFFNDFENSFFPEDISSSTDKFQYLKLLGELINTHHKPINIFELEKFIILTIYKYIKKSDKEIENFYNVFKIYLSFKRDEKEFLIFNVNSNDKLKYSNLGEFLTLIESSLTSNKFSLFDDIIKLFEDEKLKIIERLKELDLNINDFERIDKPAELQKIDANFLIEINDDEIETVDFEKLEYMELYADELNFKKLNESSFGKIEVNYSFFYKDDKDNYKFIILPLVLKKIFSILDIRRKAHRLVENISLYKPFKTIDELKHDENFNKAINVLENHYSYNNSKFATKEAIKQHLYQWLRVFRNMEEIEAILYVIANHQFISKKDTDNFISLIKEYLSDGNYLITELKRVEDNNGTHRLLNLDVENNLWRNLNLKDFPKDLIAKDKKRVVFLADNSISGFQTKKAFEGYYLHKKLNTTLTNKENYFLIEEDEFEKFKQKLCSLDEIVFLSVIYTTKSKQEIEKYFTSIKFKGKLVFKGVKKEHKDCVFDGLKDDDLKNNFKAIVQNQEFMKKYFDTSLFYEKYSEFKEKDLEFSKRNLITRLNSMPKKRFFIFTLKPKYYENPLFQYIKD